MLYFSLYSDEEIGKRELRSKLSDLGHTVIAFETLDELFSKPLSHSMILTIYVDKFNINLKKAIKENSADYVLVVCNDIEGLFPQEKNLEIVMTPIDMFQLKYKIERLVSQNKNHSVSDSFFDYINHRVRCGYRVT